MKGGGHNYRKCCDSNSNGEGHSPRINSVNNEDICLKWSGIGFFRSPPTSGIVYRVEFR